MTNLSPDDSFVGTPAPVWQLQHPTQGQMECLMGETVNGQVRIVILHRGAEQLIHVVPHATEAMRWAHDIERAFIDEGWSEG